MEQNRNLHKSFTRIFQSACTMTKAENSCIIKGKKLLPASGYTLSYREMRYVDTTWRSTPPRQHCYNVSFTWSVARLWVNLTSQSDRCKHYAGQWEEVVCITWPSAGVAMVTWRNRELSSNASFCWWLIFYTTKNHVTTCLMCIVQCEGCSFKL